MLFGRASLAATGLRLAVASFGPLSLTILLSGCGVFVLQRDYDTAVTRLAEEEAKSAALRKDVDALKTTVDGAVTRVDQALKANADRGADFMTERARLNGLVGRVDETAHAIDELKKEVGTTRAEQNARLDELKRNQEALSNKPPPVTIPESQTAHWNALQAAFDKKDFGLLRTLGREYVSRYPTDEKADDALYLMGDADVREGRGASALGEFNRVLRFQPPSNQLGKTLLGMGDAYLLLKDCPNARLAYQAAVSRFAKATEGQTAKKKLDELEKPAAGICDAR